MSLLYPESDLKAKNLRELRCWPLGYYQPKPGWAAFVQQDIMPRLNLPTNHRNLQQVSQTTFHLMAAAAVDGAIFDSRRLCEPGSRIRIRVWDALIEAGLCSMCLGSELSHKLTRYQATPRLLNFVSRQDLSVRTPTPTVRHKDLIVVHTGRIDRETGERLPEDQHKKPIDLNRAIRLTAQAVCKAQGLDDAVYEWRRRLTQMCSDLTEQLEAINRVNLQHGWMTFQPPHHTARFVDPVLRLVAAGLLPIQGGRVYTSGPFGGQALPKQQRRLIRIDGEPTVEIDSVSHSIRLAYHLAGTDVSGDAYKPDEVFPQWAQVRGNPDALPDGRGLIMDEDGDDLPVDAWTNIEWDYANEVVRDFIKTTTNILLNTHDYSTWCKATSQLLSQKTNQQHKAFLRSVVFLVEAINLKGLFDRLAEVHQEALSYWWDENMGDGWKQMGSVCWSRLFTVGQALMDIDGRIMVQTLKQLTKQDIPALAIHDGLVVRARDSETAEQAYSNAYYDEVGFCPTLRVERI